MALGAIHLGLYEEAEALYKDCGRFDLLNKFYQSTNQWDQAIAIAEAHDRIHLRATHFAHGQHLASIGQMQKANGAYESAGLPK